jgi:hypothetical protein
MCPDWTVCLLARPEGLEPPAYWFEANRSIQLSYGRVESILYKFSTVFRGVGVDRRFEFLNEPVLPFQHEDRLLDVFAFTPVF